MKNLRMTQVQWRATMKSLKTSLEERVQRERDRAADKHDPMLREIRDLPRERNRGATEAWDRKRKAADDESELRSAFLGRL
jgi:hypothetical protein